MKIRIFLYRFARPLMATPSPSAIAECHRRDSANTGGHHVNEPSSTFRKGRGVRFSSVTRRASLLPIALTYVVFVACCAGVLWAHVSGDARPAKYTLRVAHQ